MRWWTSWLGRKEWRERDLDREIRTHLEIETEEQAAAGVPVDEAPYAAHRTFGNVSLVQEATRDMWGWAWRDHLVQDIRYGLRRPAQVAQKSRVHDRGRAIARAGRRSQHRHLQHHSRRSPAPAALSRTPSAPGYRRDPDGYEGLLVRSHAGLGTAFRNLAQAVPVL